MQLYFIRHGQSANNASWEATGSDRNRQEDPPLTDKGVDQALCLGEYIRQRTPQTYTVANPSAGEAPRDPEASGQPDLQNRKSFGLTHLYCSLMIRAVQTAGVLAQAIQLTPVAWLDLHETGGIYMADTGGVPQGRPGKPRVYFEQRHPELRLPVEMNGDGWWNRPFEAEEERDARARRVLEELLTRHGNTQDRVALVSHGGFYNHLISAIFELPNQEHTWFALNNTAITRIDFLDGHRNLVYSNRADHLPAELIT